MHIDNECYLSSLCNAIILCQELHASQVAADMEDVAQALLRHLEAGLFLTSSQALRKPNLSLRGPSWKDSVSADTDLVAGALAQMAVATRQA